MRSMWNAAINSVKNGFNDNSCCLRGSLTFFTFNFHATPTFLYSFKIIVFLKFQPRLLADRPRLINYYTRRPRACRRRGQYYYEGYKGLVVSATRCVEPSYSITREEEVFGGPLNLHFRVMLFGKRGEPGFKRYSRELGYSKKKSHHYNHLKCVAWHFSHEIQP